jgi:hypothetical protein
MANEPNPSAAGPEPKPSGTGARYSRWTQAKTGLDPTLTMAKTGQLPNTRYRSTRDGGTRQR